MILYIRTYIRMNTIRTVHVLTYVCMDPVHYICTYVCLLLHTYVFTCSVFFMFLYICTCLPHGGFCKAIVHSHPVVVVLWIIVDFEF